MAFERRYFGLQGGAKAWLTAELYQKFDAITIICKSRTAADELASDLSFFIHNASLLDFSPWDTLPFEPVSPQTDISAARLHALWHMATQRSWICVTSIEAVAQRVLPLDRLRNLAFELHLGQEIDREQLLISFDACGFQRVSLVEDVGELAVRGAVVDFFPSTTTAPVRIEFLGDRIEHIKLFDADSQRSESELQSVQCLPVREYVNLSLERNQPSKNNAALPAALDRIAARAKLLETPPREVEKFLNDFRHGSIFPGIEMMQAVALPKMSAFFDYIPEKSLVILDDEIGAHQTLDAMDSLITERVDRFTSEHQLFPARQDLYLKPDETLERISSYNIAYFDHFEVFKGEDVKKRESIKISSRSNIELATKLKTQIGSGAALEPLVEFLAYWRQQEFRVAFVVGSELRAKRLHRLLMEIDIEAAPLDLSGAEWAQSTRHSMVILRGQLTAGFQLPKQNIVFISENEIFSERSYRKGTKQRTSLKRLLGTLSQLKDGDYIVHADYGIGIYRGLNHIEIEGTIGDFLHIEYADSKLYLPVQNIGKIQKFVASEGQSPTLDKLGSNRWVKTKLKVRESVVTLAGDLIKLYATRNVASGWRYEPYGAEDDRFADGFAYNETPDQWKAIEDTLKDMAEPRPMDRLVCGDVGFGKTEVALRAAYKATQHARQVAILVPTTILVEQHRQNFESRFKGYPVKIAGLSRFYTTQQNRETLAGLASGDIDIVIGTQKLLQKDVTFKDLGLLVVDEEHRFGVKQKERLKQLKTQVDVLSLTATPIPRTLHMSLLGIRDISVINTPPQDRRVIRTYIAAYSDTLVRDAILREMQRGGQCFVIHNRVQHIENLTVKLAHLVPEARFEFAHGQMSEEELEKIMQRFMKHEIDVLVSTTIVESGLDIPNANTIIIDRADALGLAQLYQLRGRVGRSDRQAYAYFIIPKADKLGEEAQKRLKVLQTLDDLGIGFNLALRDLEIRGAGNLLGKEQSGSVLAVGFELYSKILKEAVLNLKGDEAPLFEIIDPEVKLGVRAYIPEYYIPDISERLVMYQRLAALGSSEETDDMSAEINDRFGPQPPEVQNLIEVMRFRSLLRQYGAVQGELTPRKLILSFSPKAHIDPLKIVKLVESERERYKFSKSMTLTITLAENEEPTPFEVYVMCESLLRRIGREFMPITAHAELPNDEPAVI